MACNRQALSRRRQQQCIQGQRSGFKCKWQLSFADPGHTITLLGVKDLIVVQSADAILVCHKDCAQEVKAMVQKFLKTTLSLPSYFLNHHAQLLGN